MSAIDLDWISNATSTEEAFELTARLVAIRSYPGEELAVQQAVATWFTEQGLTSEIHEVAPDRPNVIVRIENGPGPTFLLNGHVDTVLADPGWTCDPWTGRREGDTFYGLGACDMKSGVAATMLATRALAQHRDAWSGTVLFASVVDEEAYSIGARALIADGLQADYCIVTEAAWAGPCLGAFGKYLVRMEGTGYAVHASWPQRGVNAAIEAAKFVATLDAVPIPAHPHIQGTQTVLSFQAGSAQYVVTTPAQATVLINRHTVPGETEASVLAAYQAHAEALGSAAAFSFTIDPPYYPSWEIDADHPFVQSFATAYASEAGTPPTYTHMGFGDMNLFATEAGIPTITFGPRGDNFHSADELVDLPSIAATTRVLLRTVAEVMPPVPGSAGE
ncbi:MAG TPA: M20/M25/M40 family metallo-hydrolase [Thermomicrobiales bacterium]|nr:M20/M25/M40 family metallo-hydrolase [Thermomicrobiales bacterium]